jgi:FkbM family methyltransferase
MQLPLTERDVCAFWNLEHGQQIKTIEKLAGLEFKNWRYTRPVIAIGRGELLFDYFLEKLLRRCPSVVGLFDPFFEGTATFPYHSFQSVITPGLPHHHIRIYKDLAEITALQQAYDNLLVLDFAQNGSAQAIKNDLVQKGFEVVDFTFYEMVMNRIAVYENWHDYRAKTADNLDRFFKLEARLADNISKRTLLAHLGFVFSGDRTFLRHDALPLDSVYTVFRPNGFSSKDVIVDAGATDGDSVLGFLKHAAEDKPSFICFEPDALNYKKLQRLQANISDVNLILHQAALGATAGTVSFSSEGTVSSHIQKMNVAKSDPTLVPVITLDDTVEACTFLKMDVEGSEPDVLRGAKQLFARSLPEAAICVYHYALDIVDCADLIDEMELGYEFKLRRHLPYIYELVLYANPSNR